MTQPTTKPLRTLIDHENASDLAISGIAIDSRNVQPGSLFAALKGAQHNGAVFVPAAIKAGAIAILYDADQDLALPSGVVGLPVVNARAAFARLAARWFDAQPEHLVAVTGTNGKSSTVDLFAQLARHVGFKAASIGTLGVQAAGGGAGTGLTTPDTVRFHEILASLSADGVTHAAFEASSHGLDQHRLDGAKLTAAAFSNITRDHLDYHETFEAYLYAKMRLIGEVLAPGGTAVINMDGPHAQAFVDVAWARGLALTTVGHRGKDLQILLRQPQGWGQHVSLRAGGQTHSLRFPLIGGFQLDNAVLAAGLLQACGVAWADILPHFESLQPVAGRLERVSDPDAPVQVIVDYAHTPDALALALKALRPHTRGELHVVFGCGGDRDAGKRPMMGGVASDLADQVVVTDDNPRTENPDLIRAQILEKAPQAQNIGSRADAIETAIHAAQPGDVVLLAGKGHETGQEINGEKTPFDDREVARVAIQSVATLRWS
ncbi:MAG: UDP-N-acetylmuramoyl-L-alanyl-D-glutamate--2,6-diaminopimelate ligase, partial [Pseudomonadota bacterium]